RARRFSRPPTCSGTRRRGTSSSSCGRRSGSRVTRSRTWSGGSGSVSRWRRIGFRVVDVDDAAAIEAVLFGELLDRPRLAEITFTRATRLDFDGEGRSRLSPERWQLSVLRATGGAESVVTRHTTREGERFFAQVR